MVDWLNQKYSGSVLNRYFLFFFAERSNAGYAFIRDPNFGLDWFEFLFISVSFFAFCV